MTKPVYLRGLFIKADEAVAQTYRDGFVGWFERFSCGVADHLMARLNGKLTTSLITSFCVTFTDQVEAPTPLKRLTTDMLWPYDFRKFAHASDDNKRLQTYEAMRDALDWAAKIDSWDRSVLDQVFEQVQEESYRYRGHSKKSWTNPTKRFRARVHFSYELDHLAISASLFKARSRNKKELARMPLEKAPLSPRCILDWTSQAKWANDHVFEVISDSWIEQVFSADFSQHMDEQAVNA